MKSYKYIFIKVSKETFFFFKRNGHKKKVGSISKKNKVSYMPVFIARKIPNVWEKKSSGEGTIVTKYFIFFFTCKIKV